MPYVKAPYPPLPPVPDDDSVHVIPLPHKLYALIDAADLPLVEGWRFYARQNGRGHWKVAAWRGYQSNGTREDTSLHRLITGFRETDHWNGLILDNRRHNLRDASTSKNCANKALRSDNTSGYKGVAWFELCGKWRVQINVNQHISHLGLFTDPTEAARAYDAAARKHFGEFACLNFPEPGERSAITGQIRE